MFKPISLLAYSRAAAVAAAMIFCGTGCTRSELGQEQPPAPASPSASPGQAGQTATSCEFAIEGMSCQGCVDNVTAALTGLPGVQSAKVSLADKKAVVVADPSQAPAAKIEAAVADAGYKAKLVAPQGP